MRVLTIVALLLAPVALGWGHPPERQFVPSLGQLFNGRPSREVVEFELQRRQRIVSEDVLIPGREITVRTPDRVIRQERVVEELVEVPIVRQQFVAPVVFDVPTVCVHDFAFPFALSARERSSFDFRDRRERRERFEFRERFESRESFSIRESSRFGGRDRGGFFGGGFRGRRGGY